MANPGGHCGAVAVLGDAPALACKKPPDHDGYHKDRLWTGPGQYFSASWSTDSGGTAVIAFEGPQLVPHPSGVIPC